MKRYYMFLSLTILIFIIGFSLLGYFEKNIDYFILAGMSLSLLLTIVLFFVHYEKQEEKK